jgi:hypothetical protein
VTAWLRIPKLHRALGSPRGHPCESASAAPTSGSQPALRVPGLASRSRVRIFVGIQSTCLRPKDVGGVLVQGSQLV